MNQELINYFAYGANLNRIGMRLRCPGCQPLTRALLPNHRLVFRGVADIEPRPGETVRGALYQITLIHLDTLDRYEGYPKLYTRKVVTAVPDNGEPVKAVVYQMVKRRVYAPPLQGYLDIIISGCREWDIPEEYIRTVIKAASAAHFGGY